jgi:hypothetical protein
VTNYDFSISEKHCREGARQRKHNIWAMTPRAGGS